MGQGRRTAAPLLARLESLRRPAARRDRSPARRARLPRRLDRPPIVDEPDAYLPTRLAEHVLTVADDCGIGRFTFMGHSWGGSIGVHFAADHPDRVDQLLLLDAGYGDVELTRSRDELVPVLLLYASESVRDVEPFRRAVPQARVVTVESGHDVAQDVPDEVVVLLCRFAG